MDGILKDKEQKLERLELDERIAEKEKNIAERRRIAKQMKRGEGKDWKKILGVVRAIRPNQETIQTLYSLGGGPESLKEMGSPKRLRRL